MPFSDTSSPATRNALGLAALCTTMGILHFAKPKPFDALIPEQLPGTARGWTLGSGVAELAVAALLVAPPTRRLGGRARDPGCAVRPPPGRQPRSPPMPAGGPVQGAAQPLSFADRRTTVRSDGEI